MGIEGRLEIDLHRKGEAVDKVVISSARPVQIARLFVGKTVAETLQTVPLVFSVCAMAQSSAAALACERAEGLSGFEDTQNAREMIVMAESVREHLLRIALDWPQYIPDPPEPMDVRWVMGLPGAMRGALFASGAAFESGARPQVDKAASGALVADLGKFLKREVYGEDIEIWQNRKSFDTIKDWAERAGTLPARLLQSVISRGWVRAGDGETHFLPRINDAEMLVRFLHDDSGMFAARPVWDDRPCETSALSRQAENPLIKSLMAHCGCGLLTRLCARLCELARLPQDMLERLEMNGTGVRPGRQSGDYGIAQVEAARGRLVHMVEIENGTVRDYRILAPTEWNFHPRGPAVRALARLRGADDAELKMQASLLISAIDPCVGFEVRVQ